MASINRQLLISHTGIFGEKINDFQPLISRLDRSTWAKMIARFNHLARTRPNQTPYQLFSDWFNRHNAQAANDLWDKMVKSYSEKGFDISFGKILNIWTNLRLFDEILASPNVAQEEVNNSEVEVVSLKLYLAINDEAAERADQIFNQIPSEQFPDIVDRFARLGITLIFPYHDLNHFNAVELFMAHFIKSSYCLQFLHANYPDLLDEFLKPYGVATWEDYLKGVLPVAHYAAMPGNDTGINYLSLEHAVDKEKSRVFLNHLALVVEDEYQPKADFLHARAHPLLKTSEDNYLIVDSVLAVNRIYNSMFFELLRISNKVKPLNLANDKFFSVYTFEFIEQYLAYSLLEVIYSKSNFICLSGQEIAAMGVDTEPDYYVRNGNKIFLYEIKGSIVTGPSKQSFSYATIEQELKEKFFFDTSDNGNKAVKQLAERAKILLTKSAKSAYDEAYNPTGIEIYPILLVSELMMTTPGINHLLNEWFAAEIEGDEVLHAARHRIYMLTIIDIDTLIAFSNEFRDDPNLLEKFILEYEAANARNGLEVLKNTPGFTEAKLEAAIWSMLESFGFFIRSKMKPSVPDLFYKFAGDLFP